MDESGLGCVVESMVVLVVLVWVLVVVAKPKSRRMNRYRSRSGPALCHMDRMASSVSGWDRYRYESLALAPLPVRPVGFFFPDVSISDDRDVREEYGEEVAFVVDDWKCIDGWGGSRPEKETPRRINRAHTGLLILLIASRGKI